MAGIAAHFLPNSTVQPALAIVVLAACLVNTGRIALQLSPGGYLWLNPARIRASSKPAVRVQLSALVMANMTLTLLGMTEAIMLIDNPEAPLLWRAVPGFLLCIAFYAVALATFDRAGELDLMGGTEIVRYSRFGGWLFKIGRTGTRFGPVAWLIDVFDRPIPHREASTLSVLIAAALLFAPLASVGIELSVVTKTAAIETLHGWRDGEGKKGEETPATPSTQEAGPSSVPAQDGNPGDAGSLLRVIVGKVDLSKPGALVPLGRSDLPYLLAALPVILRLRQLAGPRGERWREGSIYVTIEGRTLSFEVTDETTAKAHSDTPPTCTSPREPGGPATGPPTQVRPCGAGAP